MASANIYIYTQLQTKRDCFKIAITSRKRLKLKPKCPRCDNNVPELYLLKNLRMLIDIRLLYEHEFENGKFGHA